jgi:hypothetical protein
MGHTKKYWKIFNVVGLFPLTIKEAHEQINFFPYYIFTVYFVMTEGLDRPSWMYFYRITN